MGSIFTGRGKYQLQSQQGITGLETAIILIAFIVVASVFAYTVLTAGVFSSQKANESMNAAIQEVRSSITINGITIAYKGSVDIDGVTTTSDGTDAVTKMDITIAVALQGVPVDVTPKYQLDATNLNLEASGSTKTLVVNYLDRNQLIKDIAWTVAFSGANDGDFSLEATERAVLTLWLVEYDYDAGLAGLYYH
jgi:flagellin FlaB